MATRVDGPSRQNRPTRRDLLLAAVVLAAFILGLAAAWLLAPNVSNVTVTSPLAAPPTIFVSPTGSDSNSCTSSTKPCKSFSQAYRNAAAGATIEVKGGTYPSQSIPAVNKGSSATITFQPAGNDIVTIGCNNGNTVGNGSQPGFSCIGVYASNVTFDGGANRGFRTQSYSVNGFSYQGRIDTERGCANVKFLQVDIGAFTNACQNFEVGWSDVGPSVDPLNNLTVGEGTNSLIHDNLIHDFVIQNGGHFECVYWQSADHPVYEHNEFRSCAVYGVHAKEASGSFSSRNAVFDSNAFWNPRGLTIQADIQLTNSVAPCSNPTITDNWLSNGLINDCSGGTVTGNTNHPQNVQPPSPIRPRGNEGGGTTTGTTTTTPTTTTVPTTTTGTTTTTPAYNPNCKPTCDEQLNAWNTWYGQAPK